MIDDFYTKILAQINEKKDTAIKMIIDGNVQNYDEYRYLCGRVSGLKEAEFYIRDCFDKSTNERIYY